MSRLQLKQKSPKALIASLVDLLKSVVADIAGAEARKLAGGLEPEYVRFLRFCEDGLWPLGFLEGISSTDGTIKPSDKLRGGRAS